MKKPQKPKKLKRPTVPEDQLMLKTQCELCSESFTNPTLAAWHVQEVHG